MAIIFFKDVNKLAIKFDSGLLLKTIFSSLKRPNINLGRFGNAVAGLQNTANNVSANASNQQVNKKLVQRRFKYKVSTFQVLIPDKEPIEIITTAINRMVLSRLYDECIHPILEIKTLLPPKIHETIIKNKSTVNIRFRLQSEAYDIENKLIETKDLLNGIFAIITPDETPFHDKPLYEETNKNNGGNGTGDDKMVFNIADYTVEYDLSLWVESDLYAMRDTVNAVYNNCTMSTAMGNIFAQSGVNKILISPLDNQNSYGQVIIPPMNLMNVPKYLEQTYGTYYCGTEMFYDYRCLYLLNKNGICDAYEQGEYKRTNFSIFDPTKSKMASVGTFESPEDKEYHMFVEPTHIDVKTPGHATDQVTGNNVVIVDPKNNETTEVMGAGNQRGKGNAKVITDKFGNEYNKSVILSNINENNLHLNCLIYDYNDFALTPNKEFVFNFTDKEKAQYSGFYRIISSNTTFTKKGESYEITGVHEFAFKTGLSSDDVNKLNATVMPNMNTTTKTKTANNAAGTSNSTTPKPKATNDNANTVNNASQKGITESATTKNSSYEYDSLGNLKGVNIPEYNKIKDTDDKAVVEAKKKVQAKSLPSPGPKPKVIN